MLTQLIYRSRSTRGFSHQDLAQLATDVTLRNKALNISGLLLYDGTYFLQVLEGEDTVVDGLYTALGKDQRHTDLVLLLRDPIPHTHFSDFKMNTLDVRQTQGPSGQDKWLSWNAALGLSGHRDHRSERIIEAFVRGRWRDGVPAVAWSADVPAPPHPTPAPAFPSPLATPPGPAQTRFAFQPIVHTQSRRITSVEALLRVPGGESPQTVLSAVPPHLLHDFDLRSKADAIAESSNGVRSNTGELCDNLFVFMGDVAGCSDPLEDALGQTPALEALSNVLFNQPVHPGLSHRGHPFVAPAQ